MENKNTLQGGAPVGSGQSRAVGPSFDIVQPPPVAQPVVAVAPAVPKPPVAFPAPSHQPPPRKPFFLFTLPRWQQFAFAGLAALLGVGLLVVLLRGGSDVNSLQSGSFKDTEISLDQFTANLGEAASTQTVTINGKLNVQRSIVLTPSKQPTVPITGQLYYDEDLNQLAYYNGSQFLALGAGLQSAATVTNIFGGGGGVSATGGTTNKIPKFTGPNSLGSSILTDTGDSVTVDGNLNLTSAGGIQPEQTIWTPSTVPGTPSFLVDNAAVELGVKFRADRSGFIRGVRFYKGPTNTGTHTGNLWTSNGTLLASGTFSGESATGWQELRFAAPVAIASETTYVASYHAPVGQYAVDDEYFESGGVDSGLLHALADGIDGGNGVFRYSATSAFPTQSLDANNYYVDVVFAPNPPPKQYQVNGVQISSSDLSNSSEIAKRGSSQLFTGNNTFRTSSNSTSAFSIQNASGTSMLTVDTSNAFVYVGKPGASSDTVLLVLSNRTGTDDPAGTEGAMYYNAGREMFRCFRHGYWGACADLEADHAFSLYDEFMGGQTTSFGTNNIIGSLGWTAAAIGANGSISFNPSTPTPVASRPGVLALQTPAVSNQGTTLMLGNPGAPSMLISAGNSFKTAVAVGAITNQVLRIGLHTETTATTQPLSGVWLEADPALSTRWRYCYGDGTTATCAASGVDITADAWLRIEIQVRTTGTGTSSIRYYLNGADPILVNNVTVDITNRVSPAYSCYTTTTTAQNCYLDYFQLMSVTTAGR
jgi:hypothetical protein